MTNQAMKQACLSLISVEDFSKLNKFCSSNLINLVNLIKFTKFIGYLWTQKSLNL